MSTVDAWLQPLSDTTCGPDLEFDPEFLDVAKAAVGRPGNEFKPEGEPPDWRKVRTLTESLFDRTRDLRVAVYWARAMLRMEGAATLPESLRLVVGLLENFWDELHPQPDPDDGDAYARINALNDMGSSDGLAGDLRQSLVLANRAVGELRGRDIELAMGTIEPREGEYPMAKPQVEAMLAAAAELDPAIAALPGEVVQRLERLRDLMRERVGWDRAPDFETLIGFFQTLASWMPSGDASSSDAGAAGDDHGGDSAGFGDDSGAAAAPARGRGAGVGLGTRIETRNEALRAIEMVCDYLERTEPTNPAQLLLRRASRLVNKNFLELVREFAPEAFGEVAKVMGITDDGSGGYS